MPRPRLITALSLIQALLALVFIGGVVNLSFVAQQEAHDADAVRGILIGMAACGVFAFASVVAALGLWLQLRWGRWVALASLTTAVLGFAIGFYDEGTWDWDVLPWLIPFGGLVILYSLPRVGRALYRDTKDIPMRNA
jgi:hypothetical protein